MMCKWLPYVFWVGSGLLFIMANVIAVIAVNRLDYDYSAGAITSYAACLVSLSAGFIAKKVG